MNVLNNINSGLMSLVSASGSATKTPDGSAKTEENKALSYIREHGLRAYVKHVHEEKLKALMEEARARALAQKGLDEEKLAELEQKMPDRAYETLLSDIEQLTQDLFEDLLRKNLASEALDKQKEPLSHEPLKMKEPITKKEDIPFFNHIV